MNLKDLNNLDFNNLGSWPVPARAAFIAVVAAAVLGAGFWFDTKGQLESLDVAQAKERELQQTFEKLQSKAANLDAYKQQIKEMRTAFAAMLQQLPKKAEVEALLVDISQTGLAAGLEFELFKPGTPSAQEFYDLPIQIRVTGSYHEFGQFVSGAAALPRIVTLHDVSIGNATNKKDAKGELTMDVTAKIYHYREEDVAQ